MTFEQIDAHIKSANLSDFQPGGAKHFNAAAVASQPGTVMQKICAIYKVVRPILVVISNFPLIPAAWKAAVKTFIELMDSICG